MDKTQYFSILKQLHDICRDTPAPTFTGMDAYNEIMNYLYLRHLSDNKDDIPDEHNLKSLYKNYCTDKKIKEDLHNMDLNKNLSGITKEIYFEKLSEKLLPGLINQERNTNISFIKIMGDDIQNFKLDIGRITNLIHKDDGSSNTDGGQKAQKLINKIYEKDFLPLNDDGNFDIKLFPYDALGEGFEKFMKMSGAAGGNWGQYFTNPQVINYLIEKVNIKKNDKLIDPFAGSGGFLLQAKKKSKIKSYNIYGHETDDKIYKFLKFNSSIAGINLSNIDKGDTYDYQNYLKENETKYDKILSNPPFGCSIEISLSGSPEKSKYWDIMKTSKYTIKDSTGLAVYAMYKMLKDGGIAGFVSERGILNNGTENKSWEKRLRKFILENTEIKEILLLPKGIFSHTTFDTACIIFEKGKTTNQVVYHQGYFKDEDKGKGDKKMYIKENILTITLEQIVNKDWSLKYEDYIEKKDDNYEGITYKTLGEIIISDNSGEVIDKSYFNKGDNILWTCSNSYINTNYNNFPKEKLTNNNDILLPRNGSQIPYVKLSTPNNMYTNVVQRIKINNVCLPKFLYYYLNITVNNFILNQSNSIPSYNMKLWKNRKIPILPQDHQERIVEYMDKIFGSDYKKLDKLVSHFKNYDLFKILLNENYSGFDKLLELYNDIIYQEGFYKRYTTEYKNMLIQRCFKMVPSKEMKLGEVCNKILTGKHIGKEERNQNKSPYYGANGIIGHVNDYLFDGMNDIICAQDGSIGSTHLINGKYNASNHVWIIRETKLNKIYLYNILKYFINYNAPNIISGQAIPKLTQSKLNNLKIPVPTPDNVLPVSVSTYENSTFTGVTALYIE